MIESLWIKGVRRDHAKTRLICFHHAGGSAEAYQTWHQAFPESIEVLAVQLPGRAERMGEPAITDFATLIPKLSAELQNYFDKPFSFFGHSLGAILAFEVARGLSLPVAQLLKSIFISGMQAPDRLRFPTLIEMSNEQIVQILGERYLPIPKELLDDEEMLTFYMNLFRADFSLFHSYCFRAERKLKCPIYSLGGSLDPEVSIADLRGWKDRTTSSFKIKMFSGGHFYLRENEGSLLRLLVNEIEQL